MKRTLIATLVTLFPIFAYAAPNTESIKGAKTLDELKLAYQSAAETVINEYKDKVKEEEINSAREKVSENINALTQSEQDGTLDESLSESDDTSNADESDKSTPTLTEEQSQARIDELQENADAMREREQSLANRMIGGASMGAMGIGGMQVASALAEQSADDAAERDMTAYLATFRCDYGAGQNIRGGETNITLPGANILLPLYNEYATLAADLKSRKESLGMAPGIESETILDATLYDNESIGITDGAYTSLSRALSNPTGADAAEWAAQRAETAEQLKTGAIVAGVGAAVGIAGNILTNYVGDQPRERSAEINAKYDALRQQLQSTLTETTENEFSSTTPLQQDPVTPTESAPEPTPDPEPDPVPDPEPDPVPDPTPESDPTPDIPTRVVSLNSDNLFLFGTYNIDGTPTGLNDFINKLNKSLSDPNYKKNFYILLVGHTDKSGISKTGKLFRNGITTNEKLSEKRAEAVRDYIKTEIGNTLTKNNIEIKTNGMGEYCANNLKGYNHNDENGSKKFFRRVDVHIIYNNDEAPNDLTLCNPILEDINKK